MDVLAQDFVAILNFLLILADLYVHWESSVVHWRPASRWLEAEARGVDERHDGQWDLDLSVGVIAVAALVVADRRLETVAVCDAATTGCGLDTFHHEYVFRAVPNLLTVLFARPADLNPNLAQVN